MAREDCEILTPPADKIEEEEESRRKGGGEDEEDEEEQKEQREEEQLVLQVGISSLFSPATFLHAGVYACVRGGGRRKDLPCRFLSPSLT